MTRALLVFGVVFVFFVLLNVVDAQLSGCVNCPKKGCEQDAKFVSVCSSIKGTFAEITNSTTKKNETCCNNVVTPFTFSWTESSTSCSSIKSTKLEQLCSVLGGTQSCNSTSGEDHLTCTHKLVASPSHSSKSSISTTKAPSNSKSLKASISTSKNPSSSHSLSKGAVAPSASGTVPASVGSIGTSIHRSKRVKHTKSPSGAVVSAATISPGTSAAVTVSPGTSAAVTISPGSGVSASIHRSKRVKKTKSASGAAVASVSTGTSPAVTGTASVGASKAATVTRTVSKAATASHTVSKAATVSHTISKTTSSGNSACLPCKLKGCQRFKDFENACTSIGATFSEITSSTPNSICCANAKHPFKFSWTEGTSTSCSSIRTTKLVALCSGLDGIQTCNSTTGVVRLTCTHK